MWIVNPTMTDAEADAHYKASLAVYQAELDAKVAAIERDRSHYYDQAASGCLERLMARDDLSYRDRWIVYVARVILGEENKRSIDDDDGHTPFTKGFMQLAKVPRPGSEPVTVGELNVLYNTLLHHVASRPHGTRISVDYGIERSNAGAVICDAYFTIKCIFRPNGKLPNWDLGYKNYTRFSWDDAEPPRGFNGRPIDGSGREVKEE